jgi:hypothetical protein
MKELRLALNVELVIERFGAYENGAFPEWGRRAGQASYK